MVLPVLTLFDLVRVDLCLAVVDLRRGLLLEGLLAIVRHVVVVDGVVVCEGWLWLCLNFTVCLRDWEGRTLLLLRGVLTEVTPVEECFDLFLDDDVCLALSFRLSDKFSLHTVW